MVRAARSSIDRFMYSRMAAAVGNIPFSSPKNPQANKASNPTPTGAIQAESPAT